jgi:hypothetical protein
MPATCAWSWSLLAAVGLLVLLPFAGRAQDAAGSDEPSVQVIHAAPAVGPVDVYIDGSIVLVGLAFSAVSDPITLATGERNVEMVPSGRPRDDVLVQATIPIVAETRADVALIGPADDARLEVYAIDFTPLPPDLARLGAVQGTLDTGPVDLAVTGGDLLFPTIEFAGATEFADVAAGTYDLEVRYGGTDAIVLAMPGIVLEPGLVYSLFVVGESALGELQPLLISRPAESVTLVGFPAWIQAGGCAELVAADAAVADLSLVALSPFSEPAGHPDATVAESSFSTIGVPFATMIDGPHAIVVGERDGEDGASGEVLACGEIGGVQSVDGSLGVGLRARPGSTVAGVAVVSPNILDASLTDISIFVADGLFGEGGEVAAVETSVPPATPVAVVVAGAAEPNPGAATPSSGP